MHRAAENRIRYRADAHRSDVDRRLSCMRHEQGGSGRTRSDFSREGRRLGRVAAAYEVHEVIRTAMKEVTDAFMADEGERGARNRIGFSD